MRRTILVPILGASLVALLAVPAASGSEKVKHHSSNFTLYEVSENISLVENTTRDLATGQPIPREQGPIIGDVIVLESSLFADADYRDSTSPPPQFPGAPVWDGQPWRTFDPVGDPTGELLGDCRFIRWDDDRERVPGPIPGGPGLIVPDPTLEDRLGSCTLTLRLPQGDLVAGGTLDITHLEAADQVTVPIVGGSGTYRQANGTITLQQPSVYSFDRFRINVDLRGYR
jgi:hypothetical protein